MDRVQRSFTNHIKLFTTFLGLARRHFARICIHIWNIPSYTTHLSTLLQQFNVRGWRSAPTHNATRALARPTRASRRGKSPTSRHAKSRVRMTQAARASRSSPAGGAAISALDVRKRSRQAMRLPCDWVHRSRPKPQQVLVSSYGKGWEHG